MQQYINKCKYANKKTKNLTVGFYSLALQNGFFQIDFCLLFSYCTNKILLFSLLPLLL